MKIGVALSGCGIGDLAVYCALRQLQENGIDIYEQPDYNKNCKGDATFTHIAIQSENPRSALSWGFLFPFYIAVVCGDAGLLRLRLVC